MTSEVLSIVLPLGLQIDVPRVQLCIIFALLPLLCTDPCLILIDVLIQRLTGFSSSVVDLSELNGRQSQLRKETGQTCFRPHIEAQGLVLRQSQAEEAGQFLRLRPRDGDRSRGLNRQGRAVVYSQC